MSKLSKVTSLFQTGPSILGLPSEFFSLHNIKTVLYCCLFSCKNDSFGKTKKHISLRLLPLCSSRLSRPAQGLGLSAWFCTHPHSTFPALNTCLPSCVNVHLWSQKGLLSHQPCFYRWEHNHFKQTAFFFFTPSLLTPSLSSAVRSRTGHVAGRPAMPALSFPRTPSRLAGVPAKRACLSSRGSQVRQTALFPPREPYTCAPAWRQGALFTLRSRCSLLSLVLLAKFPTELLSGRQIRTHGETGSSAF